MILIATHISQGCIWGVRAAICIICSSQVDVKDNISGLFLKGKPIVILCKECPYHAGFDAVSLRCRFYIFTVSGCIAYTLTCKR